MAIEFTKEELGMLERQVDLVFGRYRRDKRKAEDDRESFSHEFDDDGTWIYESTLGRWETLWKKIYTERMRIIRNEKIRTCD